MTELPFDAPIPQYTSKLQKVNPMVVKYGPGPADKRCKNCSLLYRSGSGDKDFFKCELRGETRGPGTDHRANWETCSQFKGKIDEALMAMAKAANDMIHDRIREAMGRDGFTEKQINEIFKEMKITVTCCRRR